ncbi:MAG: ROK family transcriptional regulator [Clostridia bacterium]|nr:ROK family transcriptional regulator [Clostridia bacterium]
MKSYNRDFRRYVILNLINSFGPVSRTQLADISGFRPATVGEMAKSLLDEGLVLETGFAASSTGRRRTMLDLNRTGIGAVGIAIARDRVTAVLARLDGTIMREETCERAPDSPREAVVERIADCVARLLDPARELRVVGIGIGEPLYDPNVYQKGSPISVNYGHFNAWVRLDLKRRLEERFALPVRTLSAVTLPALVERQFGVAKGSDNFICVELSNGIGASIFCNGVAVSGAHSVAGELGHTTVDINAHNLCYCGKSGCAELGASFPELARDIGSAIERGAGDGPNRDEITLDGLRRALEQGDAVCRFYVDRAARLAGTAIANAINLLNPEIIVLYGFMLGLGDYYLDRLRAAIKAQTLELAGGYEIHISPTLENKMPLGAAAEVFTQFLRSDEYRWVQNMLEEGETT